MELKNLSSNWRKLQETLKIESPSTAQKRKPDNIATTTYEVKRKKLSLSSPPETHRKGGRGEKFSKRRKMGLVLSTDATGEKSESRSITTASQRNISTTSIVQANPKPSSEAKVNEGISQTAEVGRYVALDCEMVGVGQNPDRDSALARVSIVNYNGEQVYDSFVLPKEEVTDWRTHVSGVSPKHMTDAREFEVVQRDVAGILDGCILVGHAVRNDLDALLLSHPKHDIRDTSKHPPYRKIAGGGSPRLKILASELLGLEIQGAAHSSIEDAQATMLLFRRDKQAFEREHAKKWPPIRAPAGDNANNADTRRKKKRNAKKRKGNK
ncbi:RNA exonuclease [Histoplasma capsulatum G186AR]|uniref:RNA exonuclease 4 n=1 Tax=Ajellomyces capsulatus TaxID=5037 RepID=A0A8H7Z9K4_AJECA|nr:RNA exonuclease [Histoplasma capsulatum]QSS75677.1 RNA exonuclease [Histoplasma capsulatum G186AR]